MLVSGRCRKCGKVMESERVDAYRVKMTCSCGFSDYRTAAERSKSINPYYHKASFSPTIDSSRGTMALTMERANREHLEILSLEEISMLVSSDFELDEVLQNVADKLAQQLRASVCNIYITEGDQLVLRATHGFSADNIGKITIRIGEGITGSVAKTMQPLNLSNASKDPRYKVFSELNEEKYHSMLSFPISDKKEVYGVINVQTTSVRTFPEDEVYYVSIIANLILSAIKIRKAVEAKKQAQQP